MEDLFIIEGTKSLDANAVEFTTSGINFVGRTFENNGIQGKIEKRNFEPNKPHTITATVIGNYKYVKYQKEEYYCSQNINKLTPKPIIKRWNETIAYYLIAYIQNFVSLYNNQQGGYKLEEIKEHNVQIPTKNGEIDYDFMECFIENLEQERLKTLLNHLQAIEIDGYELSNQEEKVLKEYISIQWSSFRIGSLFDRIKTKKLPFKADELTKEPIEEFTLPCLTSSFKNQGLNYFVPRYEATVLKNVISIPSNSDVYRAYFQPMEFTVLSDAYAIKWSGNENDLTPNQYLFAVQAINKVTDLPIYSYKNKLGGWNVVKDKFIQLPVKNSEPDLTTMELLVSALKKLAIKDVVVYCEGKIKNFH